DAEHLRLTDGVSDPALREQVGEQLARLDRALSLCDDYPLAYNRRLGIRYGEWMRARSAENTRVFLAELRAARVRYARQEWPHQPHGRYLMASRCWEEALIEWEEALRLDPWDSNNAQYIAECHLELNRREDAAKAFWRTLEIDPAHARATENFAS